MGLHMKPNPFDQLVHVLLTWLILGCAVVCAAEIVAPNSLLLALARPLVVMLQGTWFIQIGHMLFQGARGGREWGRGVAAACSHQGPHLC